MYHAYKKEQELIAKESLKKMVIQIISDKSTDVKQIPLEFVTRSKDQQLQEKIGEEKNKALELSMQFYEFQDRIHDASEKKLHCVSLNACVRY